MALDTPFTKITNEMGITDKADIMKLWNTCSQYSGLTGTVKVDGKDKARIDLDVLTKVANEGALDGMFAQYKTTEDLFDEDESEDMDDVLAGLPDLDAEEQEPVEAQAAKADKIAEETLDTSDIEAEAAALLDAADDVAKARLETVLGKPQPAKEEDGQEKVTETAPSESVEKPAKKRKTTAKKSKTDGVEVLSEGKLIRFDGTLYVSDRFARGALLSNFEEAAQAAVTNFDERLLVLEAGEK